MDSIFRKSKIEKSPMISIGLPVYNGEKFLEIALTSLLSQDFKDFELIISDNCSTDATASICKKFGDADQRIRYIRLDRNYGYAFNTQHVLDLARADYFMWASDDDLWDSNWISTLLPISMSRQCLATGSYVSINEKGIENFHLANRRKLEFSGNRLFRRMCFYLEPGFLGKGCPFFGIMPTKIIKKIGVSWLAHEPIGGDTVYLYVLLGKMDIVCSPGVSLYKRQHAQSLGEINSMVQVGSSYDRSSKAFRSLKILLGFLLEPIPNQYILKSSDLEKILIILFYPFVVFRIIRTAFVWRSNRLRRNLII
ncbi:glycosyltransferase family 2 protein [Polynucleobacter sp.]|uniref:glycosyltransferase family 2 protein n=1 Tax=Polynucleobacter sp. TaxID=2029855 RepID=UPI003F69B01B